MDFKFAFRAAIHVAKFGSAHGKSSVVVGFDRCLQSEQLKIRLANGSAKLANGVPLSRAGTMFASTMFASMSEGYFCVIEGTANSMIRTSPIPQARLSGWMTDVLQIAKDGVTHGEHPFGAGVFSIEGLSIALAHNEVVSTINPSAHAEMNAIAKACRRLGKPDLQGYWLVATAEPCPMCMAAIGTAGIRHVAFGAVQAVVTEAGYGSLGVSGQQLANQFNCQMSIHGGIGGNSCDSFLLENRKR